MISRDYVMRQIHQLAQVLALVLFNKRENPEADIAETIDSGLKAGLNLGLDEVLALNQLQLLDLCRKEGHFVPELAVSVADILAEEPSKAASERAFWLYSAALEAGGALPLNALVWVSGGRA